MTLQPPHADTAPRHTFRAHPLDGAMLYFHPATGTHVRIQSAATRPLRRQAPRVAMFGITNRCNLSCDFCSRDTTRDSAWTLESAAAALKGLAAAGTLEVAFGGGEPFAFRGFSELVEELHHTTALALNVTTNGTLIRETNVRAYAGRFGQVRISLYDETDWRRAARLLARHGQRWGANLLVDDQVLPRLPALLAELAAMHCEDASLLAYVGPDLRRHLSPAGRTRLAALAEDSPVACRLSVCFGNRVPAHRLASGLAPEGDCGAGLDFISITPDQRMQACSFQDIDLPAATAEQILHGWRTAQSRLGEPSQRRGCARAQARPETGTASCNNPPPPVAIWQAYSGNNSGECVMVAKFTTVADAQAYLAELLPHWRADAPYAPEWQALLKSESVAKGPALAHADMPTELLSIGRSVIATGYDADDMLQPLRVLSWKRDAQVVPGGIHMHGRLTLLAAVRAQDPGEAQALAAAPPHPTATVLTHGDQALARLYLGESEESHCTLPEARDRLLAWAAHRPLAVEVIDEGTPDSLVDAKKNLGTDLPQTSRLIATWWGTDRAAKAAHFASQVDDASVAIAGGCVVVSGRNRWKRLVLQAYRAGADNVDVVHDEELVVSANIIFPKSPSQQKDTPQTIPGFDAARLQSELARLNGTRRASVKPPKKEWGPVSSVVCVHTRDPGATLSLLAEAARQAGAESLAVWIEESQPLAFALRRVMADVRDAPRST